MSPLQNKQKKDKRRSTDSDCSLTYQEGSYLVKVMNPAGMNFPELRNLSPITTASVPAAPSSETAGSLRKPQLSRHAKLSLNTRSHSPKETSTFLGF